MYLQFFEYRSFGGKLKEAEFTRAEYTARMKIDALTFNRLREEKPVRETVKMLVLELVERGYCGELDGEDATSYSTGSQSASIESRKGKAEALIKDFLGNEEINGVPLINRGGIQIAKAVRA